MPTVTKITLDASDYRKELEAVVAESRVAAGSLTDLPDQQISVTADTAQAETAVAELTESQPEINVSVAADSAPLDSVKEVLTDTDTSARKTGGILEKLIPESLRSKAAQAFGAIREEMNKTQGGAGNFLGKFLAGGGAIGIIAAGLASFGKLAVTAYQNWINGMKEAGELAQRNAASIRTAAEANEQLRQKSDGYLSRLSELSSAEQLSNSNKAEARKLIADLAKSYGDLGIKLDETTGKLSGVDGAMLKKLQRDKDRRIAEMEVELKHLQADSDAQAAVRDNAGWKVWGRRGQKDGFLAELTLGGEADAKEAGQKIAEIGKRIMELRKQIHEQRRRDPVADYRAKRQAENEDLTERNQERNRSFEQRKSDDAFGGAKDFDVKIANRRQAIGSERNSRRRVAAETALETAQTDYQKAQTTGDRNGMLDAEKRILQAKQTILESDEKIYGFEQQIDTLNRQRAEAVKKITDQAQYERDYNKLIVAGEFEKADALKLEKELKDQNLKLSEEETRELLEQRKALKDLNLRKNLQDQAFGLYGQAMEHAGLVLEFTEQKALRDAEKAKGGKLSGDETAMVKQLSELSYKMANTRERQLGDTSVKTNSLTARGGFAGGGKLPESDKINREIANTNKQQLEQMKQITAICEKLGAF